MGCLHQSAEKETVTHEREKKMDKKATGLSGIHARKAVQRLFNGLPVVDAKHELRVHVLKEDIAVSKRKDPTNCVYANACRRQFGSHSVAFFRHVAYLEWIDKRGNSKIKRFALPKRTTDSIMVFDRAGVADPGGYLLAPPTYSGTLDYKLARKRPEKRIYPPKVKRKSKILEPDYRSGTGVVQFFKAQKSWIRD